MLIVIIILIVSILLIDRLPEVRKFLKQSGHADSYENLKIKWIAGKDPVLTLKNDAGEVIEKIELAKLKTDDIHEMLAIKGFNRKIVLSNSTNTNSALLPEPPIIMKKPKKRHPLNDKNKIKNSSLRGLTI